MVSAVSLFRLSTQTWQGVRFSDYSIAFVGENGQLDPVGSLWTWSNLQNSLLVLNSICNLAVHYVIIR